MIASEKFSDAYLKFTLVFNQFEVREEDHIICVPEKIIRYIQNDQFFCTPKLKIQNNQNLEIIYSGHWNFSKGPDFTRATIKVNGKVYEGGVDLYVYATDGKATGIQKIRISTKSFCKSICGKVEKSYQRGLARYASIVQAE